MSPTRQIRAVGGFLSQIDSENDSSTSSPNNSLNKDQQEKAKLISEKAKFDAEKRKEKIANMAVEKAKMNEKLNEVKISDNKPKVDETSYTATDLRKRFEENLKLDQNKTNIPVPSGDNKKVLLHVETQENKQNASKLSPKAPPATPPRTTSQPQTSQNSSQSPKIHPVDSAIKNSRRSPSPPPKSPPKIGIVSPSKKSAPKILRPTKSSHKTDDPKEHKCGHNKRIVFDPFAILLDASLEGEFDLVKNIMKSVPNPSKSNDEGITALHNAVCAGHMKIVELLIVRNTKLFCLFENGDLRFLTIFLVVHAGVDINAADSDGWTPLHCAASCNNFQMVKFLVERGACIFAQTMSDRGTAADKCEELDEGYVQCSEYLFGIQEKMGHVQKGNVYALYDYDSCGEIGGIRRSDELSFSTGDLFQIIRKTEYSEDGNEVESEWWWAKDDKTGDEGYVPRNFLGMWPRIQKIA